MRLARTALEAALGVLAGDAGPAGAHVTDAGRGERLDGVLYTRSPAGGYTITLQLMCCAMPLRALGDEVRDAVAAGAAAAGLFGLIDGVGVRFCDLLASAQV